MNEFEIDVRDSVTAVAQGARCSESRHRPKARFVTGALSQAVPWSVRVVRLMVVVIVMVMAMAAFSVMAQVKPTVERLGEDILVTGYVTYEEGNVGD